MKSLSLRARAAAFCAVCLVACGGSSGNLILGGTIYNLTKTGLVLVNKNTGKTLAVTSTGSQFTFAFVDLVNTDDTYDVQVQTQPTGAVCTPSNNSGKANLYNTNYIVITCVTDTHALKGTITGLTGAGLVLVNGAQTYSAAVPATPGAAFEFTMAQVADGAPYGITVLTNPAGQGCTVTNGVGVMGSVDITTAVANPLLVACTAKP